MSVRQASKRNLVNVRWFLAPPACGARNGKCSKGHRLKHAVCLPRRAAALPLGGQACGAAGGAADALRLRDQPQNGSRARPHYPGPGAVPSHRADSVELRITPFRLKKRRVIETVWTKKKGLREPPRSASLLAPPPPVSCRLSGSLHSCPGWLVGLPEDHGIPTPLDV
jgi:hypothetical protein